MTDGDPIFSHGNVIQAHGLGKRFAGPDPVLSDVSFSLKAGERVALIGANGAGKSTLLRCLVGLLPNSTGSVELLGERFERQPGYRQKKRVRQHIGFVFQFHGLVGRLDALSNTLHGALGQGLGFRAWHQALAPALWRARAMEALSAVGLAERASSRVDTLSGGQSQRVAIARSLVHEPRLLIADEPAASLDPQAGLEVMSLFSRIALGRGISLLYTTHNLDHVEGFADRVVALSSGRVVLDAPMADLDRKDLASIYGQ